MESPESFILVNKLKNRIKVFKLFQSTLKQAQEMMEIEYGCVYKRSSKPVMKGSRVETIEQARKEYKELLEGVGGKLLFIIITSKHLFGIFEDNSAPSSAPFSSENENK